MPPKTAGKRMTAHNAATESRSMSEVGSGAGPGSASGVFGVGIDFAVIATSFVLPPNATLSRLPREEASNPEKPSVAWPVCCRGWFSRTALVRRGFPACRAEVPAEEEEPQREQSQTRDQKPRAEECHSPQGQ